jgi:hypothetical protein
MLAGDEQGVKPDRHLLHFVTTALGRASITDDACVRIVQESAQLLQEDHPWMTPPRLDYSIGEFEHTRHRDRYDLTGLSPLPALESLQIRACESAPRNFRAVLRGQRLAAFKASLTRA